MQEAEEPLDTDREIALQISKEQLDILAPTDAREEGRPGSSRDDRPAPASRESALASQMQLWEEASDDYTADPRDGEPRELARFMRMINLQKHLNVLLEQGVDDLFPSRLLKSRTCWQSVSRWGVVAKIRHALPLWRNGQKDQLPVYSPGSAASESSVLAGPDTIVPRPLRSVPLPEPEKSPRADKAPVATAARLCRRVVQSKRERLRE